MRRPQAQQWIIRGSIASAALSVVIAACVTNEHPRPTCAALADGGPPPVTPTPGKTYFAVPSTDAQAPTALGIAADPGPTCTNCQAGDELEVMLVSDFEDGYGPAWINYGEPGSWVEPHGIGAAFDADGRTIMPPQEPYFGLQATDLRTAPGGVRCNSRYALHMVGGPFLSWGGGYATQYVSVRGKQYHEQYCFSVDPAVSGIGELPEPEGDSCRFWMAPVIGQASRLGLDVAAFDGIAFWARRGPGAAAALRVALIDVNTAKESALNAELRGEAPACKRVVECCRQCVPLTHAVFDAGAPDDAGAPGGFTLGDVTDMRCHLPGEPMPPFRVDAGVIEVQTGYPDPNAPWESLDVVADTQLATNAWESWNRDYEPCCPPTLAEDPKYGGNEPGECATYVFKYDFSSGSFCQRPGEILPEKNDNRCEDGFETSVVIDTEWKLFTIPWSELRRSTIGRPPIDPSSIWTIRLYPTAGWLDTYIDDIGFYRKRQ